MNVNSLASEVTHNVRTKIDDLVVSMDKSERVFLRASAAQKSIIEAAATAMHKSVSEFILDSAVRDATDALLDQRVFVVSPEVFAQVEDLLAGPPTSNPGLDDLRSRPLPWK